MLFRVVVALHFHHSVITAPCDTAHLFARSAAGGHYVAFRFKAVTHGASKSILSTSFGTKLVLGLGFLGYRICVHSDRVDTASVLERLYQRILTAGAHRSPDGSARSAPLPSRWAVLAVAALCLSWRFPPI